MGQTYKKFVKHVFDDEIYEKTRKQAGKRNHSRHIDEIEDDFGEIEDNKYKDELEILLKRLH